MTRQEAKALRARYVAEAQAKAHAAEDARRTAQAHAKAKAQAEARALATWEASVRHDMARRAHRTAEHRGHVLHRPHAWHRTATPPPAPQAPRPVPRSAPVRGMGLALLVGALLGGVS